MGEGQVWGGRGGNKEESSKPMDAQLLDVVLEDVVRAGIWREFSHGFPHLQRCARVWQRGGRARPTEDHSLRLSRQLHLHAHTTINIELTLSTGEFKCSFRKGKTNETQSLGNNLLFNKVNEIQLWLQ